MSKASVAVANEPEMDGALVVRTASITGVAACAAGIASFLALTVFPAARPAKAAWKLGKIVAKYGPKVAARVFRGARGITNRTVEKDLLDLAKELSGVAMLSACGI